MIEHFKNKRFLSFLYLLTGSFIVFIIFYLLSNKTGTLKLNPILNKVYSYTLVKTSEHNFTYQSVAHKIHDTVHINFSMQSIRNLDSTFICRLTFQDFLWNGKVNYHRDSLHSMSTNVLINDSGMVEDVQDMNDLLQDIEKDSATGKYLVGVIPDHISENAVKDLLNKIFSVVPAQKVKVNDTWIRNIILITKAPVNISNFNVMDRRNGDTAVIAIQSNVSARQSPGDNPYMKGTQKGTALISYSTGMPFLYETQSEIVTTTNYYDVGNTERFVVRLR